MHFQSMVCLLCQLFNIKFFYGVEIPRKKLLHHLRDHIDGVRAMFTVSEGVDPEDSAREIKVPFELFIPYMQLLCRVLSIRLVLPEMCEVVMAKTFHGRLETALVSIFCFQAHCHMFILKRRGIGVWMRSLASLC